MGVIKYEVLRFEPESNQRNSSGIMIVKRTEEPNWLGKIFGNKKKEIELKYRGSSTTWYLLPNLKPAHVAMNRYLWCAWMKWKHERKRGSYV